MKRRTVIEIVCAIFIELAILAIPLLIVPTASDAYRLPKAMLLRATAIVVIAFALAEIVWNRRIRAVTSLRDSVILVAAAVVAWWGFTALTASNHRLSFPAWIAVACGGVIAVATYVLARRGEGIYALVPIVLGGVVTAVSCLASLVVAKPSLWTAQLQGRPYAFLGSAHDAAVVLAVAAIVATVAAATDRGVRRWLWLLAAVLIIAAIAATRTLGAMAAYAAAALVLLWLKSRRAAVVAVAAAVLCGLVAVAVVPSARARAVRIASGDPIALDDALSGRLVAFTAAARMFAAHPIFGVGPGCYAWEYFPQKIAIEDRYPILVKSQSRMIQFGEAHNDHLQILAETGLPGYAIFIAALIALARGSRGGLAHADDVRVRFARAAAAPLAAAIALLALAEFPFQIAAGAAVIVYAAAVCAGWNRLDALD